MSITRPITKLNAKVAPTLRVKSRTNGPNHPAQHKKRHNSADMKRSCGFTLSPSLANVADIERSNPPTTAMQVEREAIIPIANAVPYETPPVLTKLTKPTFCKTINKTTKAKAIGMAILKSDPPSLKLRRAGQFFSTETV